MFNRAEQEPITTILELGIDLVDQAEKLAEKERVRCFSFRVTAIEAAASFAHELLLFFGIERAQGELAEGEMIFIQHIPRFVEVLGVVLQAFE